MGQTNLISFHQAQTLSGLFDCRVERSPDQRAYRFYRSETDCWDDLTWAQVRDRAALWQRAMQADGLEAGDRVAVMLNNCLEWVLFDLAATGLELVTVPLYVNDRQENFSYILQSTQSRLLLTDGIEQWQRIEEVGDQLDSVERIVTLQPSVKSIVIRACVRLMIGYPIPPVTATAWRAVHLKVWRRLFHLRHDRPPKG